MKRILIAAMTAALSLGGAGTMAADVKSAPPLPSPGRSPSSWWQSWPGATLPRPT